MAEYEYADDHGAWLEGRAAHERRWLAAEAIVSALMNAAGARPPVQRQPTRESHAAHLSAVQHFAQVLARGRANAALYGLPAPRITPFLARAMASRGVLESELSAEVSV